MVDYSCNYIRENVAVCFDYALDFLNINEEIFINCFTNSKVVKGIENLNPKYAVGKSGVEICKEILNEFNVSFDENIEYCSFDRSPYYWVGSFVSYYAFHKKYKYSYIFSFVTLEKLLRMYNIYHEMDISHFVEKLDDLRKKAPSKLKTIREKMKLSQSDLSRISDVSVRTIQSYEQRQKDINNAEVMIVISLAKALKCNIEDILEI